MIFRVIIRVSYNEAYFDFDSADKACNFARMAAEHSVESADAKKISKVSIEVINPKIKESEDE